MRRFLTAATIAWISGRMRSAALALLVGAALGTFARPAGAGPRTSSLAWVRMPGAEACVDARTLALAVERRLGRVAFVPPTLGEVAIEGRIERSQEAGVWRATIRVFGAGGTAIGSREIEAAQVDCRAIDEQLELVIALLVDPDASLVLPRAAGSPASSPAPSAGGGAPGAGAALRPAPLPPAARAAAALPACPPAPAAPSASWRVGGAAEAVGGVGLVPGPASVGVGVRAHATPPRGPGFELGGVLWASPDVREAPGSPAFSLAYGRLSVCPIEIVRGGTALSGCVGAMLGSLRVEGPAVPIRFRHERLVFDLSLDTRVRRRFVGPLFGAVGLGIAVPTVRDVYFYTDAAGARHDIFRASPVSTILDLGLGLELP
ncbi:hypothetical protein AB3662_26375 [Sorangium cellulosum]|uniref:hypothetical protein n=1 Tax=Sorangium cellulosum TaxID=56 RepID=UPI003D9A1E16